MSRQGNTSSRQSSILKSTTRLLSGSLMSSDRSFSIQNSFTATRKSRFEQLPSEQSGNLVVRQKFKKIMSALEQGPEKYTDDLFPPVDASVFNAVARKSTVKNKETIIWVRVADLYPGRKLKIIPAAEGKEYRA